MVVAFVGDVEPQASAVKDYLLEQHANGLLGEQILDLTLGDAYRQEFVWRTYDIELLVVAGFRKLIPGGIVRLPRLGTVGFHSAKLPEYPGRAPVPWALLRGDYMTENTMLFLDEGIDSGDIIDRRPVPIYLGDDPGAVCRRMAKTCVEMLQEHLPALLTGTAPRTPQDLSKRGPLTTKDGWDRWFERERLATGHA